MKGLMIKKSLLILGLAGVLVMLCVIASCENSKPLEQPAVVDYTVSFQSGGGTEINDKTVREGTTLNLELSEYQPELDGYFFDGWYLDGDTEQTTRTSIRVTGNITLVAKWVEAVTVTLEMGGGALEGDQDSFPVRPESFFEAAWFTPSRKGYVFLHWYLKDDPFKAKVERIQVDKDLTLVAEWEEGWVITLELDGGEYYAGNFITVAKLDEEGNPSQFELASIRPLKADYVLEGWYYDAGFASRVPQEIILTGDITLYIKWVPLSVYAPMFGVWKGAAGTYLIHHDPEGSGLTSAESLIGFFFSDDEIRSFSWTDSSIDGKEASLADGTLTVGTGESAQTFTPATTTRRPAGSVSMSKLWIKGVGDDPLSLFLFEDGSGFLYADGRNLQLSYYHAVRSGISTPLYLIRRNTDEIGNLLESEVLLTIPVEIVENKPKLSGFEVMGEDPGFILD
jgi:uncharacterized repeat protein (TIGR02543 family)